ncbi:hypothetical protein JXI42_07985 [bacterium]|nr:hypothetical protein [bacterium]
MSRNISLKEFIDEVQSRIGIHSKETLKKIIIQWAKDTPPKDREIFLSKLAPVTPEKPEYDQSLIDSIDVLLTKVKNGGFCTGWGWDHKIGEERAYGDESWAYEVDSFFDEANGALMSGYFEIAKEAYSKLFEILDYGTDDGQLPGASDPEDMIDTDLGEARALYLRAVYLSPPADKRIENLLGTFNKFEYETGDNLNLTSVINAGTESLPGFDDFLDSWIDTLKSSKYRFAQYLLREAVKLSGGIPGIAELAHKEGKNHPGAYVEWIKTLEDKGDFKAMLEATQKGLAEVPKNYLLRAEIAEGLVRAGEYLKDKNEKLTGCHEAFYSDPSLKYLLPLLYEAEKQICYQKEIETAINRVRELLEHGKKPVQYFSQVNRETEEAYASEILLTQAYLFASRYEEAFNICAEKDTSGWNYDDDHKNLVLPFFLVLLSRDKGLSSTPNIKVIWEKTVKRACGWHYRNDEQEKHFRQLMGKVIHSINLSDEEKKKYTEWCIEEIGKIVDAIVSKKRLHSYDKAANLLLAAGEMLATIGKKAEGSDLIETYSKKYYRYSAFRRELRSALKVLGMLDISRLWTL